MHDPEMLSALQRIVEARDFPQVGVLDTSCVRTGLAIQVARGVIPTSIRAAQRGTLRLFMEYETLMEVASHLERFAEQLGVQEQRLKDLLNRGWLPHISVVHLPEDLLRLDDRVGLVEGLDPDDVPTAALTTLLSPVILLTHDKRDFAPLGVHQWAQGTDAAGVLDKIESCELALQGLALVPAAPLAVAGWSAQFVIEKIGRAAWWFLPLVGLSGYYLYRLQSPAKQEQLRELARFFTTSYLERLRDVSTDLNRARVVLEVNLVSGPRSRAPISAVLRIVAKSPNSLSAQQIWDRLPEDVRPPVTELRAHLHANKGDSGPFVEVRRGGFQLGHSGYHIG